MGQLQHVLIEFLFFRPETFSFQLRPVMAAEASPSSSILLVTCCLQSLLLVRALIQELNFIFQNKFPNISSKHQEILRQAIAGLLWSKQFYHYIIQDWLVGDPNQAPPPGQR